MVVELRAIPPLFLVSKRLDEKQFVRPFPLYVNSGIKNIGTGSLILDGMIKAYPIDAAHH
jgi:hypothetical protein